MVATMFAGCGNSEANTNASSTEAGKTGGAEAGNVSISFYTTETGKDDMLSLIHIFIFQKQEWE